MKLKYTFWVLIVLSVTSYGQNVGIGTSSPNALLDVYATNNGVLIPRVALTGTGSASPLTSPTVSTLVYNTATVVSGATSVSPGFYYWNGSAWVRVIDNSSLTGATTVSNTSSTNTLSTTVNGVTGATVPIVNSIGNTSSANAISTTVNGITGTTVPIVNSISNTSSANTLSTTVNGVTGTGVNIITGNTLSLSGNTLTSTVNGVAPTQSLSGLSLSGDVTGTLAGSSVGRIQGIGVAISSLVSTNLLQYNGTNWVNVTPASVLNAATTNTLSLSGNTLTSTVNGIASSGVNLSSIDNNIYNSDGTLTGSRTVTMGAANLTFSSSSGNLIFNPSSTGNVGIGTASPLNELDILNATSAATVMMIRRGLQGSDPGMVITYGQPYLRIGGVEYRTGSIQSIGFGYTSGGSIQPAEIGFNTTNTAGYTLGDIVFANRIGTGNTAPTEVMRITSTGNVGIGTTSPTHTLDVAVDINTNTGFTMSGSAVSGNYLRGNGTNFVSSAIQTSDIPSGSGNYIQNGTTAQTANFNITGNGTAAGAFITPGYFYNSGTGENQVVLNSVGADYGVISNPTIQVWSLGYTASPTTLGTSVLSWTPSGYVGIGSTSPLTNLYVSGTTTPAVSVASTNYPTTYNTQLGTQAGAQGILVLGNNGVNEIRFGNTGAGGMGNFYVNNTTSYSSSATGTLAMTLASNGFLGVGTASPVYQMQVSGTLCAGYVLLGDNGNHNNNTIEFVATPGSTTYGSGYIQYYSSGFLSLCNGGGYVGIGLGGPSYRLTLPNTAGAAGEVVANSFAAYSDERIKSDLQPLKYGLQTLMQLQPLQYFQHNSTSDSNGIHIKEEGASSFGLLAQKTYKIVPEMVNRPKDESKDLWTMDYSKLGPILVKAMQEQEEKIEYLQAQNEQLKSDNNSLRSENAEIIKTMKAQLDLINERLNIKSEK